MGGGPQNPILIKDEHEDDIKPLNNQISAITIESDSETESSTPPEQPVDQPSKQKQKLMRELKALGATKFLKKPDYTRELNEPSWGDESEGDDNYTYEEPEADEYEFKEMDESDDEKEVKSEEDSDTEMKWED